MEVNGKAQRLELKICERCGGLWLRPGGSAWVYCGPCKQKMDELPVLRWKPPAGTRRAGERAL